MPRTLPELPRRGLRSFEFQRSQTHRHQGIDLPAPEGSPIFAVAPGIVTHASAELEQGFSGYGAHIAIATDAGNAWNLYAHLSRVDVRPGQHVYTGQLIGAVGRTCFTHEDPQRLCGGAHLHFEASPTPYPQASEAQRLDPVAWLQAQGTHPLGGDAELPTATAAAPDRAAGFRAAAGFKLVAVVAVIAIAAAARARRR